MSPHGPVLSGPASSAARGLDFSTPGPGEGQDEVRLKQGQCLRQSGGRGQPRTHRVNSTVASLAGAWPTPEPSRLRPHGRVNSESQSSLSLVFARRPLAQSQQTRSGGHLPLYLPPHFLAWQSLCFRDASLRGSVQGTQYLAHTLTSSFLCSCPSPSARASGGAAVQAWT